MTLVARFRLLMPVVLAFLVASECALLETTVAGEKTHRNRTSRYYSRHRDYAALMAVEAESGRVLLERNPTLLRSPASLVKMMTALLLVEALDRGEIALSDTVSVPWDATLIGGSKVGLYSHEEISLEDLAKAMMIASANDAAITIADHLAGSQAVFIMRMNQRAEELGMYHTHYVNPHGLDHWVGGSLTTARDQSLLARELIKHPIVLKWSSSRWSVIRGGQVIRTTNRLLGNFDGLDGLKTGYIGRAGYCLASTAERNGFRVVCILLGASSNSRRFSETAGVLTTVFSQFQKIPVVTKGQDMGRLITVHGGRPSQIRLVSGDDVSVVLANGSKRKIRYRVEAPTTIDPPLRKGAPVGRILVHVGDSLAVSAPAVAEREVKSAGFLERLGYKLGLLQ